jgi:putative beta-barrel porin BBP2
VAAAVLACAGIFLPWRAWALSFEEQFQGLTLTPFLSERFEYESNIFQTPNRIRGDAIFRTIPGFLAELTRGPFSVSAGYRAEIINYATLTDQNTVNQSGLVQLKADMPRLKLQLRDDFTETTDPPGSELTGPIKSQTNVLAPTAEYRLTERFSVGVNYTWTHIHYPPTSGSQGSPNEQQNQAVQQIDEDDQQGGATVWWKWLPKSDIGLSFQYVSQTFDNDSSRNTQREIVGLTLRGDLTAKLSSTFKIGVMHQEATSGGPAFTGLVMGGGWIYQATERTQFTLNTDRSPQVSVFESAQYYVSTSGWLGVRHEFPARKLAAWLRVGAGQDDYNTKQPTANGVTTKYRVDTLVGTSVGVDYAIQPWLRTGIDYGFKQRTSNFPQFNYDDNKISGRITVQF